MADRLDAIELRSWIRDDSGAGWTAYQEGAFDRIRPLGDLIEGAPDAGAGRLGDAVVMFCGTLPVLSGGIRPARYMRMEMRDPQSGDAIALEYAVNALEIVS